MSTHHFSSPKAPAPSTTKQQQQRVRVAKMDLDNHDECTPSPPQVVEVTVYCSDPPTPPTVPLTPPPPLPEFSLHLSQEPAGVYSQDIQLDLFNDAGWSVAAPQTLQASLPWTPNNYTPFEPQFSLGSLPQSNSFPWPY